MESPAHVLVVADKTAATPVLLEALRDRATAGPARFHLLVPNPDLASWRPSEIRHPHLTHGEQILALSLPLIEDATASPVAGSVSRRHDPMDAVEEALANDNFDDFDEIILSTLPHSVSRWLHVDLPHRLAHLGLPITTVTARERPTGEGA